MPTVKEIKKRGQATCFPVEKNRGAVPSYEEEVHMFKNLPQNRALSLVFLCLLLVVAVVFLPSAGLCGTIQTNITSRVSVFSSGNVEADYTIGNTGTETAFHVTVTAFLGLEAHKSDALGNNSPGGTLRYTATLAIPDLKPGKYTLVTRVTFDDQAGTQHRVYQFTPVSFLPDKVKDSEPAISLELNQPSFTTRSLHQPEGKFNLVLKNRTNGPLQTSVSFYLGDGFTTAEPDRFYQLTAQEKKEDTIPLTMARWVNEDRPYHVVMWYELGGVHYSMLREGTIKVEEKPLFIVLLPLIGGFLLIAVLIILFKKKGDRLLFRRGKK